MPAPIEFGRCIRRCHPICADRLPDRHGSAGSDTRSRNCGPRRIIRIHLGFIAQTGHVAGLQTAISSHILTMRTRPASQALRNARQSADLSPKPRYSDSLRAPSPSTSSTRVTSKRRTNKQPHLRGGAKAAALDNDASKTTHTTSSRHIRNRQAATRTTRAADRSHTPQATEDAVSRPVEVASASLPHLSPAKDLLRRARATAAADADWLGRRPFIMDVILGNWPVVSQHREDAILDAIELSQAALGPVGGVYRLEEERSLELYWEAQATSLRWAAGDSEISQHIHIPDYQVSAERSTVTWPGDEDAVSPPSNAGSSPPR
ncbi:hypothetical protein C8T65DRAFT_9704 [Cerioporus squamosus]|nr:hypothetical protein C8T65DRAFT_9704 [Cerioporus squamosus]